jgi:hypothetical protein
MTVLMWLKLLVLLIVVVWAFYASYLYIEKK